MKIARPISKLLEIYCYSKDNYGRFIPALLNEERMPADIPTGVDPYNYLVRKKHLLDILDKYKKSKVWVAVHSDLTFFYLSREDNRWKQARIKKGTEIKLHGNYKNSYFNFYQDPSYGAAVSDTGKVLYVLPEEPPEMQVRKRFWADKLPEEFDWFSDPYVVVVKDNPPIGGVCPILELVYAIRPDLFDIIEKFVYEITGILLQEEMLNAQNCIL